MADIMNDRAESSSDGFICAPEGFKPNIIGLYGVPGAGKSHYLSKLRVHAESELSSSFQFFEGSSVISSLIPGGLPAFKELPEDQKSKLREEAIRSIKDECTVEKTAGIVAGHATFWDEKDDTEVIAITPKDLEIYSHILYLRTDPEVVQQQRINDCERDREIVSIDHLERWQMMEESVLRTLCRVHGINFCVISARSYTDSEDMFLARLWRLVSDLGLHNEHVNRNNAMTRLGQVMNSGATRNGRLKTMLVMDADKTLAPQDAGDMFWGKVSTPGALIGTKNPLKELFGSSDGYSYHSFRQATLLYEESVGDGAFDAICDEVASEVTMHPEFVSLLHQVAEIDHVGAVVVTSGLRRVWEKVLEREGLSESVKVIGGGRISDGFVVTAEVKADLVAHIQSAYGVEVCAFGDSPLDLPMLLQADRAIVVVGDEYSRSASMDAALGDAIKTQGLVASQLMLPDTATPRLDSVKLPILRLSQADIDAILCDSNFRFIHAGHTSASALLMTQTRNATVAGPALKEAHRRIGWYLAVQFIGKAIGLESYEIPHVQGGHTEGHRLKGEKRTTIVPLMRGGGPMAEGINEVFPLAMLVHAIKPDDLKLHHVEEQGSIILVDSVINSGKSMIEFIKHVRKLHATIRIVVAANVVQDKVISGETAANLARYGNITLVALRLSKNQFTGSGDTDTGNRLFNTTHLR
ncbi:hypothetical protein VE03_06571 [Pseudogymnoascus sp. 23342-1-I1]|nr:hypothetical protein VE03_06571 [Pseudogymnoascus sp. 23342-1-I1]